MTDVLVSSPAALPTPRTSLVGREAEIAAACSFLLDAAVPLLTLTGPGGVGKTRLALAVAHAVTNRFPDGVAFVDLAPLTDPAVVPTAVATVLGVLHRADRSVTDMIVAHMQDHRVLLLLDNCEHLASAVANLVADLLKRCSALQVLATSRAPLRVQGEQLLPVPTLWIPSDGLCSKERLGGSPAVTLFTQRARAVKPTFALDDADAPVVAEICQRLDGLPLAIELAAARVAVLPPATLLTLLKNRLPVLGIGPRDAPDRQQTMRDAIAWSYALLSAEEQTLFRRLAVFVGSWTLEAAAAVSDLALEELIAQLDALVSQSLIDTRDPRPKPRYAMLETIRSFALDQLGDAAEDNETRQRHAAFYIAMAKEVDTALARTVDPALLNRLEADLGNLRAALTYLHDAGDAAALLQLVGALGRFWQFRSYRVEGIGWLERVLRTDTGTSRARARALVHLGLLANASRNHERAIAAVEEGIALHRALGDNRAVAQDLAFLGDICNGSAEYARATVVLEEAITSLIPLDEAHHALMARYFLALAAYGQGELERAAALLEEVVATSQGEGDMLNSSLALTSLGLVRTDLGDHGGATRCLMESRDLVRQVGTTERLAGWLACVATLVGVQKPCAPAARLFGAGQQMREAVGSQYPYPGRTRFERSQAQLRQDLGEVAYNAAWAAGQALSRDEAFAEATQVLEGLHAPALSPTPTPFAGLTRREREVLRYLVEGATDQEIASALSISPRTAGHHVSGILAKLGVETRRSARAYALQHHVLTTGDVK